MQSSLMNERSRGAIFNLRGQKGSGHRIDARSPCSFMMPQAGIRRDVYSLLFRESLLETWMDKASVNWYFSAI